MAAMQEWLTLPADYLHPSTKLSLEELALVEPLSIGAHGVWRSGIGAGETALVIGAGPIGLAVVAGISGCRRDCGGAGAEQGAAGVLPEVCRGHDSD